MLKVDTLTKCQNEGLGKGFFSVNILLAVDNDNRVTIARDFPII